MKRNFVLFTLIAAVSFAGAACGNDSPSGPSRQGTVTATTFTIPLSAANEIPAVTNAEAGATGSATVVLRITRDPDGNAVSATANFEIEVANFPAGAIITMAHIHPGATGSTGPILVNTGLASGELTLTNGAGTISKNGVNVPTDQAVAIVNNAAGYYFNVHSQLNPPGVVRGQLQGGGAVVDPGSPTPTPDY